MVVACEIQMIICWMLHAIQEIEEVDTDEHYQPKTPIEIIEVTLKQKI